MAVDCLTVFLVVSIVAVLSMWLVVPCFRNHNQSENFNGYATYTGTDDKIEMPDDARQAVERSQYEIKERDIVVPPPFVPNGESTTGTIMDGGDWNRAEMNRLQMDKPWSAPDGIDDSAFKKLYTADNRYLLDDGGDGNLGLTYNMCSKSCCSSQWPTPFAVDADPLVCKNKDKFVPSSYMCNNSFQDSGCVCLTQPQYKNLYNRGNNA